MTLRTELEALIERSKSLDDLNPDANESFFNMSGEFILEHGGELLNLTRSDPWQSIETAPKDGTKILVWLEERNDYFRTYWNIWWVNEYGNGPEYKRNESKVENGMNVPAYNYIEPTHWMPDPRPKPLKPPIEKEPS